MLCTLGLAAFRAIEVMIFTTNSIASVNSAPAIKYSSLPESIDDPASSEMMLTATIATRFIGLPPFRGLKPGKEKAISSGFSFPDRIKGFRLETNLSSWPKPRVTTHPQL
jgi:hypothetical protein